MFLGWWCCCMNPRKAPVNAAALEAPPHQQSKPAGVRGCHRSQVDPGSVSSGVNHHQSNRRGDSSRNIKHEPFNWSDHPSLINDAVENGWGQFAFKSSDPCGPKPTSGLVEIKWEAAPGSAENMQKIRLNRGMEKTAAPARVSDDAAAVTKTELPLPGPPLGSSSFPQEAYFEITLLSNEEEEKEIGETEKVIRYNSNCVGAGKEGSEAGTADVKLSVGLSESESIPLKHPGSYPASIGFNSNGSVFLDGVKLVPESDKGTWSQPNRVIGCGFNPMEKKVFFTLDSELVRVINCKPDAFGAPLFPTIAGNADVTVLFNLGQAAFKYAPPNSHRTPNPCFVRRPSNYSAEAGNAAFEDSSELFSMAIGDAGQWHNRFALPTATPNRISYTDNDGIHGVEPPHSMPSSMEF